MTNQVSKKIIDYLHLKRKKHGRVIVTRAKCKIWRWLAPTEKGNWPANRLIGAYWGSILKITPRHKFTRYIAAKYRFRGYEWKNAREFLGLGPRGLLGRWPQTFGRLLKPASHRTSWRSKRNSYIRRHVAPRDEIARRPSAVQIWEFARRVNCGVAMCCRAFPKRPGNPDAPFCIPSRWIAQPNVIHARPSCGERWQILIRWNRRRIATNEMM